MSILDLFRSSQHGASGHNGATDNLSNGSLPEHAAPPEAGSPSANGSVGDPVAGAAEEHGTASRMELGVDLPFRRLTRSEIERAGARLKEPTQPSSSFLLQTYARDTGAVLTTLSVPLYVKGRRFGVVTLGWDPERLTH